MKILFCGDLVPSSSNDILFKEGKVEDIIGNELTSIFNQADEIMVNLEAPMTNSKNTIEKCGPNLKIDPLCIKGVKKMGITIVGLSNNHIMDYGEQGLKDTIEILNLEKINYTGVGNSLKEARKPFVVDRDGLKIGIYTCAEHEFSIATDKKMGANPFDPLISLMDISDLRRVCDKVIVLYHGGKEYYRYPSPRLQKICRAIIDHGANLVICQHSHCIGAREQYKNADIIYGQGNFIFDEFDKADVYAKTSILIECDISLSDFKLEFIPIVRYKNVIRLAMDRESELILEDFNKRSLEITDEKFIESNYRKFANAYINTYLGCNVADKFIYRIINRLCKRRLISKIISKKQLLAMLNYIECEAHRELWIEGIKNSIKEKSW